MIKTQYPYVDDQGVAHNKLIKTYTEDAGKGLRQIETGVEYGKAVIDLYPCRYTYEEVDYEEPEEPEGGKAHGDQE